jgi:hypothetical protein
MTRRRRKHFHEPSLVPLADLLTNTVGIAIFILIFTVLTAGGAAIAKRLPMEHATSTDPLRFFCTAGRVLPLDEKLSDRLTKDLGKPTYDTAHDWVQRFNAGRIEDPHFVVTGEGAVMEVFMSRSLDLTAIYTPKPEAGEAAAVAAEAGSAFRRRLAAENPAKKFAHFNVAPDGIAAFVAARAVAHELGFETGWRPIGAGEPLRFSLSGGGQRATAQ